MWGKYYMKLLQRVSYKINLWQSFRDNSHSTPTWFNYMKLRKTNQATNGLKNKQLTPLLTRVELPSLQSKKSQASVKNFKLICPCTIAAEIQTGSQRKKINIQKFHSFLSRSLHTPRSLLFFHLQKKLNMSRAAGNFRGFFEPPTNSLFRYVGSLLRCRVEFLWRQIFYRFFMAVGELTTLRQIMINLYTGSTAKYRSPSERLNAI